ncbi:MAG: 8-oxo-dGTP diphosphatase MutT [Rhodospirillaceae bacterium]|jgi:8-oxo-dGTP diphosphatase
MKVVTVVAAALMNERDEILLTQRPQGKAMAGLWEFPGGKLEDGETPEQALSRELKEELGLTLKPDTFTPYTFVSHSYDSFHLLMPLYICRQWTGDITPQEKQAFAWVAAKDLNSYPMPPADLPLIPMFERDF